MKILTKKLEDCLPKAAQGFQRIHIFDPDTVKNGELALEYVILPTGAESRPHSHIDTHTVVFTIQGSVRIYFGEELENQLTVAPQESVYIPPGVIHHVVNEHEEDMIAVVARTPSVGKVKEFPHLINSLTVKNLSHA